MSAAEKKRCFWAALDKPHYVTYHDEEWGVPVHDDPKHFEKGKGQGFDLESLDAAIAQRQLEAR